MRRKLVLAAASPLFATACLSTGRGLDPSFALLAAPPSAVRVDGIWAAMGTPEPLVVTVPAAPSEGPLRAIDLPRRALPGSVTMHARAASGAASGARELAQRDSLAAVAADDGFVLLPASRWIGAAELERHLRRGSKVPPPINASCVLLRGDQLDLAFDAAGGAVAVRARIRGPKRKGVKLSFAIDGTPTGSLDVQGEAGLAEVGSADVARGAHQLSVILVDAGDEERSSRPYAAIDGIELANAHGDVAVAALAVDEAAECRFVPLPDEGAELLELAVRRGVRESSTLFRPLRLESNGDRREAWLLPPPSQVEVACDVPAASRLRFAVGFHSEGPPAATPAKVTFKTRFRAADGSVHAIDEIVVASNARGWIGRDVALPPGVTGRGWLQFETHSDRKAGRLLAAVAAPRVVAPAASARPNVIVYLVDTLRADALSCMGAELPTTPFLDSLAQRSYLFKSCYSPASWTQPAVATCLTGRYPSWHGVQRTARLARAQTTLAERLQAAGYSTAAFVASPQVSPRDLGFDQGFARFVTPEGLGYDVAELIDRPSSDFVADLALPWIKSSRGEPFFAYLHTIDPHTPYRPPPRYRHAPDSVRAGDEKIRERALSGKTIRSATKQEALALHRLYLEEVRAQDDQLAVLFDRLERNGLADSTIVIVTSDHGEQFLEHGGLYHCNMQWDELLHVPLLVHVPQSFRAGLLAPPLRIDDEVQHVDLVPSLLDLLGIDPGRDPLQGRSFVPLLRGETAAERPIVGDESPTLGSIAAGGWKLIWYGPLAEPELVHLYDVRADPRETRDLAAERPADVRRLLELRRAFDRSWAERGLLPAQPAEAELSEDEAAALRALGYAGG